MLRSLRGLERLRGLLASPLSQQQHAAAAAAVAVAQQQRQPLGQHVALHRAFAAEAAAEEKPFYNVPAGHINSDLSDTVCNIGLGRLRDLTMRQDLAMQPVGGQPASLADLFKGKRVVVFGVPDMGKVCTEKHVPGFIKQADALAALGVQSVYCIAVAPPDKLQAWAESVGIDGSKVTALADERGAFTRALGLEFGDASSPAKSQRYAALINGGLLVKLRVERSPADCDAASGESMTECVSDYFAQ